MLVKWLIYIYTMITSTHKSLALKWIFSNMMQCSSNMASIGFPYYVYLTILKALVVTESTVNHNQRQTRYLEFPNFHWINRIENSINNYSLFKAKPRIPTLIIDYIWTEGTNSGTHSCTGSIGNPPGTMTLEIRDGETGNFTSFSSSTKSLTTIKENGHYNATLKFSINFNNENIRSQNIRCVANNQHTLSISESPCYSREVFVSPLPGKPILLKLLT